MPRVQPKDYYRSDCDLDLESAKKPLAEIVVDCNFTLSAQSRDQLIKVVARFLAEKKHSIPADRPTTKEIAAALARLDSVITPLVDALNKTDVITRGLLGDKLVNDSESILHRLSAMTRGVDPSAMGYDPRGKRFNQPFFNAVTGLVEVFESATGKKATVSCGNYISQFEFFVRLFIKATDKKSQYLQLYSTLRRYLKVIKLQKTPN